MNNLDGLISEERRIYPCNLQAVLYVLSCFRQVAIRQVPSDADPLQGGQKLCLANQDQAHRRIAVHPEVREKAYLLKHLMAEPYQKTEERTGYRNGSRDRPLVTRVGSITLEVPQFRKGKLDTDLFERYQRSERALIATLVGTGCLLTRFER